MVEVIVIGPEHPCIRCITTQRYAEEVAKEFPGKVTVRKILTTSQEAKRYGQAEGGYEISVKENVAHDEEGIKRLLEEIEVLRKEEQKNWPLIEEKMQQIQEKLKPIERKAQEKGYLMTPVLVVNGRVKSWGYVPTREKVKEWITEELSK
ncbi:MAG: hypothetical protein QXF26_10710 [Candidatus Bathyarchaeia archaeon]